MSQHLITTYYHCIIVSGRWWHNDHWIYKYHRAYLLHEDSNNTSLCTTGHLLRWSRRLCTRLRTLHHIQNIRPFNCPRHQCDQDQWSRVLCKTVIMESGPCYQTHHLLCILYSVFPQLCPGESMSWSRLQTVPQALLQLVHTPTNT